MQYLQRTAGDRVMASTEENGVFKQSDWGEVPTSVKWEVSRLPTKTRHKDCGQLCGSIEKQMEKPNWGIS